ncbi:MAG TPA: YciI family protein [Nocardioides sp.]|uniref:YciI family protein n=1 Tax=Nocardioides sp. TaxID=35761 RepID=UPI002F407639
MTDYIVMFPADNEAERAAASEADRQATFDTDYEFGQLLAARGGAVTGGAGLTHSSRARTIKRGPRSNVLVTEGPYAESAEQLSGFFIVTCDEYDALVEAAQVLVRAHPVVEIRPVAEF